MRSGAIGITSRTTHCGALALYTVDAEGNQAKRTWYFFKFQTDSIR